jgi:ribosomal-protein-alanine N-acetyltransferase
MTDGVHLDAATAHDLPCIMDLERSGFAVALVERQAVFQRRLETFPAGFLVLRDDATGRARGYLATERWATDPGVDPAAYALGHDPVSRYSPSGPVLYLASMTIAPALRGRRLGAVLFREGRARILQNVGGIERELLIVHDAWQGAQHLYTSEGFVVRAVLPDFFPVSAAGGGAGCEPAGGPSTSALLMEHNRPRDGVCRSANPLPAAALPRP